VLEPDARALSVGVAGRQGVRLANLSTTTALPIALACRKRLRGLPISPTFFRYCNHVTLLISAPMTTCITSRSATAAESLQEDDDLTSQSRPRCTARNLPFGDDRLMVRIVIRRHRREVWIARAGPMVAFHFISSTGLVEVGVR